jgi:hypothetical protein
VVLRMNGTDMVRSVAQRIGQEMPHTSPGAHTWSSNTAPICPGAVLYYRFLQNRVNRSGGLLNSHCGLGSTDSDTRRLVSLVTSAAQF